KVAHGEPRALHVDREVDFGAARQVLDVAIATMLTRRDGAGALGRDFALGVALGAAAMRGRPERRRGERRDAVRIGGDQCPLARIPGLEQLLVGQATDQARMDEAREIDPRHMAGMGVETRYVPDRLL